MRLLPFVDGQWKPWCGFAGEGAYPRSDRPERKGADLHRRRKVRSLSQALPQAVRMAATS